MGRSKLPQGPGSRVFSGARASFYYNGTVVALASGCSGSEEITYEPVDVLDHLDTIEHVATGYRVSFSCQMFRSIDATGAGDSADRPGSIKQQNIFPKFEQILTTEGVDVIIQDKITQKVIFQLSNVKAASYNFNITARGLVGTNVSFVATRARDESEDQT
jgi:hypothetical protein